MMTALILWIVVLIDIVVRGVVKKKSYFINPNEQLWVSNRSKKNNLRHVLNGLNRSSKSCNIGRNNTRLYGIPRMYRWLTSYYPTIKEQLINDKKQKKVDVLYIDMNGVIHHCTHANKNTLPIHDEHELLSNILIYLKNLFYLVKPQKLVYVGVDGVSPKAKMNQQRKRRFLSLFKIHDNKSSNNTNNDNIFNPNCITTGTDFMYKINLTLNKWFQILKKKKVFDFSIIFSGSDIAGEGEHKILKFIRETCKEDTNFKNYSHCIYGLDADLIMLSLVSHLNNIFILRDKFKMVDTELSTLQNIEQKMVELSVNTSDNSGTSSGTGSGTSSGTSSDTESDTDVGTKPSALINGDKTKEVKNSYTKKVASIDNYKNNEIKFNYNIIKLETNDQPDELDRVHKYNDSFYTKNENLNAYDFEILDIYKLRKSIRTQIATYINKLKKDRNIIFNINRVIDDLVFLSFFVGNDFLPHIPNIEINEGSMNEILNAYIFYIYKYSNYITYKDKLHIDRLKIILKILSAYEFEYFKKRGINENVTEFTDKQKYKKYYYLHKFGFNDSKNIQNVINKYIEGLFWNMHYYHFGEYPYHYAPLCSDLLKFEESNFYFEKGKPYSAYTHLISVLPQKDKNLLPDIYKNIYVEDEVKSFFPEHVKIDPNGKKESWEYIVQLPFINCNMINRIVNEKSKKDSRLKYKL
ncbi:exonuclease, putative, partial [Hepatocystis sp. ex Piliocolobus tephrosceles]